MYRGELEDEKTGLSESSRTDLANRAKILNLAGILSWLILSPFSTLNHMTKSHSDMQFLTITSNNLFNSFTILKLSKNGL